MENSEDKKDRTENEIERKLNELAYPANEDIYNQEEKVKNINLNTIDTENGIDLEANENSLNIEKDNKPGDNLDVPGSELDDAQEEIGSEDEENNYYSQSDN